MLNVLFGLSLAAYNSKIVMVSNKTELEDLCIKNVCIAQYSHIFWGAAIELPSVQQSNFDNLDSGIIEAASVPWFLDRLDQHDTRLNNRYNPIKIPRNDVPVYVFDTGVACSSGAATCIQDCWPNTHGFNDNHGHGTTIASIVSSVTPTRVCPVKVLADNGFGSVVGILNALETLASLKTSGVLVMALSGKAGPSTIAAYSAAFASLRSNGIVPVAAAGNKADNACFYGPAASQYAITVGANDKNDEPADFSNYGPCVDIWAPGVNLLAVNHNGYMVLSSGTSGASAVIAGVVSHLASSRPANQREAQSLTQITISRRSSYVAESNDQSSPTSPKNSARESLPELIIYLILWLSLL